MKGWGKAIIALILFISTEFMGSISLGPLRVRHFAVIGMGLYLILTRPKINWSELPGFKWLLYYYALVAILGLTNSFYSLTGYTVVFARFVPTVFCILFLINYLNTKEDLDKFVLLVLSIGIINCLATFLQGIGNPLGLKLAQILQDDSSALENFENENINGFNRATGLAHTTVGNGYILMSLGIYGFTLLLSEKKLYRPLLFLVIGLTIIGLFFNQERLVFYLYIAFSTIGLLLYSKIQHSVWPILVLVILGVSIPSILSDVEFGRLLDLTDDARVSNQQHYWSAFFPTHAITGDLVEYIRLYGSTPHNLFIETTLFGGIIGLAFFVVFLYKLFIDYWHIYLKRNIYPIIFGAALCSMILVSYKHSSGIHTGLTLTAYLYALYVLSKRYANETKKLF